MKQPETDSFPADVASKLKTYVYRKEPQDRQIARPDDSTGCCSEPIVSLSGLLIVTRMFRGMGMRLWLEKAERGLEAPG